MATSIYEKIAIFKLLLILILVCENANIFNVIPIIPPRTISVIASILFN